MTSRRTPRGVSPTLCYAAVPIDSHLVQLAVFISTPYGCVVSVSPERFVRAPAKEIETAPIKGTIGRGRDATVPLDPTSTRGALQRRRFPADP